MKRHPILWLIIATSLLRLAFAVTTGLGVDESYMVTAGRALSLGYFDHPPASWWLSWGAARLLGTDDPIVVRLPFILLFAVSQTLMASITTAIAGPRAAWWAVVTLNLSPVFGVTTGSWVLPDGPLDTALLGTTLCIMRAMPLARRQAWGWWAGAGLCAGLALFSKYSAILTIGGLGLFLLFHSMGRDWLARPHPYVAGLLTVAVFAPVLIWNATHGWISLAFQGDRATGGHFHPLGPLTTLGGEALFILPWLWLPMMILFVCALWPAKDGQGLTRGVTQQREHPVPSGLPAAAHRMEAPAGQAITRWRAQLLASLAAPPIIVFALIAAWSSQRILFHWAAPGYLLLFPLLGQAIAEREQQRWIGWTLAGTAGVVLLALGLIVVQVQFDVLGGRLARMMRTDPTPEAMDWTSVRADLLSRGLLSKSTVFAALNWREAGKFGYALGPGVIPLCLNVDARQFQFAQPAKGSAGRDVIVLSLLPAHLAERIAAPWFRDVETLPDSAITLNGRLLQRVTVLQGQGLMPQRD